MLSVIDVISALSIKLETEFPDFPVNDRDEKEGFSRPSFFVDIDNVRNEAITIEFTQETAELTIVFFAENVYKGFLRLLECKEELWEILREPLEVSKTEDEVTQKAHILFSDVSIVVSNADKAMTATLTAELIQKEPEPTLLNEELIENLETNFN